MVFGEVADEYDDVRAGYAPELVDTVFDYLGRVPRRAIEVGAGTGKATSAFAGRGRAGRVPGAGSADGEYVAQS